MRNIELKEKPIGGYIELQLPPGEEYYPSLLGVNTGRNCLEYILRVKGYETIYLPYFTCDVLLEPIKKLNVELKYYHIDPNLDPIIDFDVGEKECFVYTNYFGLKDKTVAKLTSEVKNLIIDNSQAFFSNPHSHIDTFYSCRKFFGVPDGAYLHLTGLIRLALKADTSINRFSHLIKSIDVGIEEGYTDFVNNNRVLFNNNIREMSSLTKRILSGIDYQYCRKRREDNFRYLHEFLKDRNQLRIEADEINGPMAYPFLYYKSDLKQQLISRKVFVPTYWPNVFEWTTKDMFEYGLADNLVALPIDHRYTEADMKRILTCINQLL
ncbi:hypothetical protein [Pedobacter sp. SYSU D00535]|uniref:hypothetical protein n=1 Tax=Pedobacter sp. SYSU D00535 TaxID=2810308 RepID=UPI001A97574B|nr:hypothetical protein [Pedobacter sp. SYSU D00535]